jgi:hypothetical protein
MSLPLTARPNGRRARSKTYGRNGLAGRGRQAARGGAPRGSAGPSVRHATGLDEGDVRPSGAKCKRGHVSGTPSADHTNSRRSPVGHQSPYAPRSPSTTAWMTACVMGSSPRRSSATESLSAAHRHRRHVVRDRGQEHVRCDVAGLERYHPVGRRMLVLPQRSLDVGHEEHDRRGGGVKPFTIGEDPAKCGGVGRLAVLQRVLRC